MTAAIISGKQVSDEIRIDIAREVTGLAERGVKPGLAVVLVGEDAASQVYVRNKEKSSTQLGFHSEVHRLDASTSTGRASEAGGRAEQP